MNKFYRMTRMGVAGHVRDNRIDTDKYCMQQTVTRDLKAEPGRILQNTGNALLEFPMRTAMHEKASVSSAISVCHN